MNNNDRVLEETLKKLGLTRADLDNIWFDDMPRSLQTNGWKVTRLTHPHFELYPEYYEHLPVQRVKRWRLRIDLAYYLKSRAHEDFSDYLLKAKDGE